MRNRELFKSDRIEFFLMDLVEKNGFQLLQLQSQLWARKLSARNETSRLGLRWKNGRKDLNVAILARHVLEHNVNSDNKKIFENIRSSGAEYLIGTWQVGPLSCFNLSLLTRDELR